MTRRAKKRSDLPLPAHVELMRRALHVHGVGPDRRGELFMEVRSGRCSVRMSMVAAPPGGRESVGFIRLELEARQLRQLSEWLAEQVDHLELLAEDAA